MNETIETYNKIASHFSSSHFDTAFWQKEFGIFKKLVSGKKIVDIGCGAGRDAVLFTEEGFDYLGIDASEGLIAEAKKRVAQAKFLIQDFYHLDLPKGSFDGFWAAASILHIPKAEAVEVLKNLRELLKPNGIGFISIKEKRDLDEGIIEENKYGGIKRFFAFYTDTEFQKILTTSGFSIIESHTLIEADDIQTHWLCYFIKEA